MDSKDAFEIVKQVAPLVTGAVGGFGAYRLASQRQQLFFKNTKRSIFVFGVGNDDSDLIRAIEQLKAQGFLTIEGPHALDSGMQDYFAQKACGLVVLRYTDSEAFWTVFDRARGAALPVLVYAPPPLRIDPDTMQRIGGYSFSAVCNFPLRLVSDVFSVISTFQTPKGSA